VQRQYNALHAALQIVAEEGRRAEISLPIEQHVVDCVIHVDEKAAEGYGGSKRERSGQVCRGGARDHGGCCVSARTHLI
jgi:hypothetical protein